MPQNDPWAWLTQQQQPEGRVISGPITPVGIPRGSAIDLAADNWKARAALAAQARNRGDTGFDPAVAALQAQRMPAKRRDMLANIAKTTAMAATLPYSGPEAIAGKGFAPALEFLSQHAVTGGLANAIPGAVKNAVAGTPMHDALHEAAKDMGIGMMFGGGAAGAMMAAPHVIPAAARFLKDDSGAMPMRMADDAGEDLPVQLVDARKARGIAAQSLRGLSADEALAKARTQSHLIQNKATGQFIGAPRGIKTRAQLRTLRAKFDQLVENGVLGGDWYDRTRAGTQEITGDQLQKNDLFSNEAANWSASASPDTNLGFALGEHNSYELGEPRSVRYPDQHEKYVNARDEGGLAKNGPKTGIYEDHINPNTGQQATGTNDIWHARNWGFKNADGTTLARGLSEQEHTWLDYETLLAMDRANAKNLGGRSNWTIGEVQASPWVYAKGVDLAADHHGLGFTFLAQKKFGVDKVKDLTPAQVEWGRKQAMKQLTPEQIQWGVEQAAKSYPDYFQKYSAYAPHQSIPSEMTGHMPLLHGDGPEAAAAREAYHNDPRSSWNTAPGNRDAMYDAANLYTRPTTKASGHTDVARPLVDMITEGDNSRNIAPLTQKGMGLVENVRGYVDGQALSESHKIMSGTKAGVSPALSIAHSGPVPAATLDEINVLAKKAGLRAIDTGEGLTLSSFDNKAGSAKDTRELLKKHPELTQKLAALGESEAARVASTSTARPDYAAAQQGKGIETRKLIDALRDPRMQKLVDRLQNSRRVKTGIYAKFERDRKFGPQLGGARQDIQNARTIMSHSGDWANNLEKALKDGVALPAVMLSALGIHQMAARRGASR